MPSATTGSRSTAEGGDDENHRRSAVPGSEPEDRGDHPGRSGRRAVGLRRDHRVRRHRQHPGPVRHAVQGDRRGTGRAAREHRRLGLGVLRVRQELVRQEPRLRPEEPQGPGRGLRQALQAAIDDSGLRTCSTSSTPRSPPRSSSSRSPRRGTPARSRSGSPS